MRIYHPGGNTASSVFLLQRYIRALCESMYDDPEDLALAQANAHMLAAEAARLAHSDDHQPGVLYSICECMCA